MKDLGALRKDRYVPRVAWFTAIGTAAVLVADYLFKSTAAATLTKDELGPFFATFYAAINALALVVQLFLTSALVQRFECQDPLPECRTLACLSHCRQLWPR